MMLAVNGGLGQLQCLLGKMQVLAAVQASDQDADAEQKQQKQYAQQKQDDAEQNQETSTV